MFNGITSYIKDNDFRINIYHNKINIVNYEEIISLQGTRVSIKYRDGNVVINGKNLLVKKLLDKELLLTGNIKLIEGGSNSIFFS